VDWIDNGRFAQVEAIKLSRHRAVGRRSIRLAPNEQRLAIGDVGIFGIEFSGLSSLRERLGRVEPFALVSCFLNIYPHPGGEGAIRNCMGDQMPSAGGEKDHNKGREVEHLTRQFMGGIQRHELQNISRTEGAMVWEINRLQRRMGQQKNRL
jgi:hypothetical protein